MNQSKESELRPYLLIKCIIQSNLRQEIAHLVCRILKSHTFSRENFPIFQQGIYGRVFAREIGMHNWDWDFSNTSFGSAAEVALRGNPQDVVRHVELLFRRNDAHRIQVGFG